MFVQSSVLDRYQIGGISDSRDKQCQGYIIKSAFGSIRFKVIVTTSGISEPRPIPRPRIRAGLEFVRPDLESDFKLDF